MIGKRLGTRATLEAGGGLIVGGELDDQRIGGGAALIVSGSLLLLAETSARPFVLASTSLSGSHTETHLAEAAGGGTGLTAFDLRLGVTAGKTLWDRLTVYAAARVFGGPVFWERGGESVVGSDRYHVALGGGVTLRLPSPSVEFFLEGMGLGERGLSGGVGVAF